eukprot:TRINITY_DN4610_c0_g1_i6.p7 TRINITY_DN4610_c0_g1~~TRINITY_DN4610_c0_g1_i6.p7  ORF type:complete len:102 (+),score=23.90 TRINITY_DN4610_c0_g1_i6:1275-1580(+)
MPPAMPADLLDARFEAARPDLYWRCWDHVFMQPSSPGSKVSLLEAEGLVQPTLAEEMLIHHTLLARLGVMNGKVWLWVPEETRTRVASSVQEFADAAACQA